MPTEIPLKKSILLSAKTHAMCKKIGQRHLNGKVNWSASINNIANNYIALMRESLPKLSKNETKVFYQLYKNKKLNANIILEANAMPTDLSIAIGIRNDKKIIKLLVLDRQTTQKAFLQKVQNFNQCERAAIIYMAQLYLSTK